MSTFAMSGSLQFSPKLVDGSVVWATTSSTLLNLTNGTGSGQADGYWAGTLTIPAGDDDTLDLLALAFSAFGGSGTVGFASIKLLAVSNGSANVTISAEPGATNGWDQLSGSEVGKSGTLLLYSPVAGLPVGSASKTVKFTNNGTVTTLTGDLTTGSGATIVTGLSSTSGLAVGMMISGAGVPSGTKIASITNSTTLVMTASATIASGSGGTSLDFAWPDAVVSIYAAGILD